MNLDDIAQIRFNGFEIGMIAWNGYILYNNINSDDEAESGNPDVPVDIPLYEPYQFRGREDIEHVETMVNHTHSNLKEMFSGCINLRSIYTTNWDTSNVSNMSEMFKNCESLIKLDLSNFNTSSHSIGMFNGMFYGCSALKELNISNFYLDYYDSEEGYMAQDMFYGCDSLKTVYMNNCNAYTIEEITSQLPRPSSGTGYIIYVNRNNLTHPDGHEVTAPSRWRFKYVD